MRRRSVRLERGLAERARGCADVLGVSLGEWVLRACRYARRMGWGEVCLDVPLGCGEDGGEVVSVPLDGVLEGRTGREIAAAVAAGVRWCEERPERRWPVVMREAGFAFRRDGSVVGGNG